jgi:transcriptional antiterminator NusG
VIDDPSNPDDTREERPEPRPEDVGAEDPSAAEAVGVEPTAAEEVAAPEDEAQAPVEPQEPERDEPQEAPDAGEATEADDATEADATPEADDTPEVIETLPEAGEPVRQEEAEPESEAEAPVSDVPTELPEEAPGADLQESESNAKAPPEEAKPDQDGEVVAVAEEAPATGGDPFSGPGDWYVIHTYAGYENKVRTNLESRINTMQMQEKIFDVVIPMEDVMEIKGGRKQVVQKKVFPGYLLVKMVYDDDSWYVVRNTPGVTGFVSSGTGQKPTPLSRREVEKILAVKKEEVKPAFRLDFEEGDVVRIISGPFADFNGTIDEINVDQSKVKVLVNIFDRETPVELSFDQVARV